MINTNEGVTPMTDHSNCIFSRFTKHWNCCQAYITVDEADCDCYDNHS